LHHWAHRAARRVELQDAVAVIGDEDASVAVDRQAVGLAVVLAGEIHLSRGGDPEHPAPGHVDDVEIAGPVEGGALEKALRGGAAPLRGNPGRGASADAVAV